MKRRSTANSPAATISTPAREIHRDPDHYFGFPYAWQYNTMLIEPPVYLTQCCATSSSPGGKLVVKEFRAREEIRWLPEPVIFKLHRPGRPGAVR